MQINRGIQKCQNVDYSKRINPHRWGNYQKNTNSASVPNLFVNLFTPLVCVRDHRSHDSWETTRNKLLSVYKTS